LLLSPPPSPVTPPCDRARLPLAPRRAAPPRPAPPPQAPTPERFLFDIWPTVCLIERGGALTLVEYGRTEPLGTFRTEHATRATLSVRIHDAPGGRKVLAYLLDANTLVVSDVEGAAGPRQLASVSLPDAARITEVQLSSQGGLCLVRDARRRLHLVDVLGGGARTTLLPYCR
jgi:hypothetical protein